MQKRKNMQTENTPVSVSDQMAEKISSGIQWLQKGFATIMNKAFRQVESKRLKVMVILFVLLSGGYSLFLIAATLIARTQQVTLKVEAINRPRYFNKTGSETKEGNNSVSETTFQKIQSFKQYMDSLKLKNVRMHDSILFQRPMLMDSVRMLEELYYSQKQNTQYEK